MRYAVITQKNKREIVLLRGTGCTWGRCTFCDYHTDACQDRAANYRLNCVPLGQVTGQYQRLEVINSGSFPELDEETMNRIQQVCTDKGITTLHFECHWLHRHAIAPLRARFHAVGITIRIKGGIETFDTVYRETLLRKGMGDPPPEEMARYFDECCLLQGLAGQTAEGMCRDIERGLVHFRRVCVNLMETNTTAVMPDPAATAAFMERVYPRYQDNERVDILLNNTDFGVGVSAYA